MAYKRYVFSSEARDFIRSNKKTIIILCTLFLAGMAIGITIILSTCDFDHSEAPLHIGGLKMFFKTVLLLMLFYTVILFSTVNFLFSLLAMATMGVLGGLFGSVICKLIGYYAIKGILNLLFVYLPFFVFTFILMLLAITYMISEYPTACGVRNGRIFTAFKGQLSTVVILFLINAAISFFIFVVWGLIFKVIVI